MLRFAKKCEGGLTIRKEPLKMGEIPQKKGVSKVKLLLQIGLVFGIYWISQCIESILPYPFPASVISLLLVLVLLLLRVIKLEQVREKADFLMGNLGFFFVPASVGLINYVDVIRESAVAFFVICAVSTVVTFAVTAWAVQLTCHLMEKRKEGKK